MKNAVNQVIKAHPALSFIINFNKSNELVFEYRPELLQETEINYSTEEQLEEIKKELIKPFKIFKSSLFRSFIFETEEYNYLFLDLHHVIGDGNTVAIILRDIEKAYFDVTLNAAAQSMTLAQRNSMTGDFLSSHFGDRFRWFWGKFLYYC